MIKAGNTPIRVVYLILNSLSLADFILISHLFQILAYLSLQLVPTIDNNRVIKMYSQILLIRSLGTRGFISNYQKFEL